MKNKINMRILYLKLMKLRDSKRFIENLINKVINNIRIILKSIIIIKIKNSFKILTNFMKVSIQLFNFLSVRNKHFNNNNQIINCQQTYNNLIMTISPIIHLIIKITYNNK